jgi:hypothetical protein
MSTGQTLLAVGAIALLMATVVNVNRTYVNAAAESVQQQRNRDAINYAQSLAEIVYANASQYDTIETLFANANDINDPTKRLTYITAIQDTLFATVIISAEVAMIQGKSGKIATIQVYSRENGVLQQQVRNIAAIIRED